MSRANATFKIEGWDEQQYAELEGGGKLTRANVEQASRATSRAPAASNG